MSENNKGIECPEEHKAEDGALGHLHGHIHEQIEEHANLHIHEHICPKEHQGTGNHHEAHQTGHIKKKDHEAKNKVGILAIRSHSGLSGDMFVAGLAALAMRKQNLQPGSPAGDRWLGGICADIMPHLANAVTIKKIARNGIGGWLANVELPASHEHRTLKDILVIVEKSAITSSAKKYASNCFELLAACEADVHGCAVDEIHFHEVGALDSILDICASCELFARIGQPAIICGPVPIADGTVRCAHGLVPAPSPATLKLLRGVPVFPFNGNLASGELVTPTGIALLRALGAEFGPWPEFVPQQMEIVYGQRIFPDAANGVIFALGESL